MIETIRNVLGLCTLLNVALLYTWFLIFTFSHHRLHQLSSRWSMQSVQQFDRSMHRSMALLKNFTLGALLLPFMLIHLYLMMH